MVSVENIVKTYYSGDIETPVLKGISLSVADGEFVSIIGKSGAGKSTLLYQLGLLDHPTSGEVIIDGIVTSELSVRQRTAIRLQKLGYVFQDYALIAELTAQENVMLPLLMAGLSTIDAKKQTKHALTSVGLGKKLDNQPSALSGGEQQRVSIARAIAGKPKIVFADEPTANLDSETSQIVIDAFKDLHKKTGQTIIMVTHEMEYAEQTQRIISLRDGKIV